MCESVGRDEEEDFFSRPTCPKGRGYDDIGVVELSDSFNWNDDIVVIISTGPCFISTRKKERCDGWPHERQNKTTHQTTKANQQEQNQSSKKKMKRNPKINRNKINKKTKSTRRLRKEIQSKQNPISSNVTCCSPGRIVRGKKETSAATMAGSFQAPPVADSVTSETSALDA